MDSLMMHLFLWLYLIGLFAMYCVPLCVPYASCFLFCALFVFWTAAAKPISPWRPIKSKLKWLEPRPRWPQYLRAHTCLWGFRPCDLWRALSYHVKAEQNMQSPGFVFFLLLALYSNLSSINTLPEFQTPSFNTQCCSPHVEQPISCIVVHHLYSCKVSS